MKMTREKGRKYVLSCCNPERLVILLAVAINGAQFRAGHTAIIGEENKALVHLINEEFWNKGNLAVADELMAAHATIVLPGRGRISLDDFKVFAAGLQEAFPNWYATTDEPVAEGPESPSVGRVRAPSRASF